MKYFFVLGNNPTLSIAEISAVLGTHVKSMILTANTCLIIDLAAENAEFANQLIKNLGGTIKIGQILGTAQENDLLKNLINQIDTDKIASKFNFGLSKYGKKKINLKPLGMEIKKFLVSQHKSCRFVVSHEPVLSSVVVTQNKLLPNQGGREFVLIESEGKFLLGQTLAVQLFKELSARDYGRPARDDYSGMLPPKLAQIMINLSHNSRHPGGTPGSIRGTDRSPSFTAGTQDSIASLQNDVLLDPFCGSGTILTEAALMGYKNLIGSDISKKAIEDTKNNFDWIKNKYQLKNTSLQLLNISAVELTKKIKANSIDVIVTEPYLGPQRGRLELKIIKDLEALYSASLAELSKTLKSNGKIVMIWPVFTQFPNYKFSPNLGDLKIVNPLPEQMKKNYLLKTTIRNTIIYGREGQKVWREIVILKK